MFKIRTIKKIIKIFGLLIVVLVVLYYIVIRGLPFLQLSLKLQQASRKGLGDRPAVLKLAENNFLQIFKDRLASQNLEYASSSLIDNFGDLKIFLKNTKDNTGYIILNTKKIEAENLWTNFISAISSENLKLELKNNLKNLEYIDLRFANKIFYRFSPTPSPSQ